MSDTPLVRTAVVPPPLKRVLKYGMSGEDVKLVQTILQKEGYFSGTPLGNFKKLTRDALLYFQNTHIDEDGQFLEPDCKVGEKTWWALHNANGAAQRNFIPTDEGKAAVETAPDTPRNKFLAKLYAMHKQGIAEIPDGSNYGDGVTPIVQSCGFSYGIFWCLAAQSYAFRESIGEKPLGAMHVGCATFWNEAVKVGKAHRKGSYKPIPGDIAIYNYGKGLTSKGLLSGAGHAAGVARVARDGSQFNALEGNIGNRFKHSIRNVSERTLIGFVNLFGDENNRPSFPEGVTAAPTITASYSGTR